MGAPYTARCACGSVTATIRGEPVGVRQCWCRQCQQISAGGATTNAMFRVADIELNGELATHGYLADSGNTLTQSFCPTCGTAVMGRSSARPHLRTLRFGFLDEGHGLAPTAAIWLDEAPPWATIDPALERFDRQPPAPPS
ncbi:MAG: GFA family protein [Novosphingobium sp.]|nr:GFA family protein [Novosphingobium sp.]